MSFDTDFASGGGFPIGAVATIPNAPILYTAPDRTVWLTTGFLVPDVTTYPEAPRGIGQNAAITVTNTDINTNTPTAISFTYDVSVDKFFMLNGAQTLQRYSSELVFEAEVAQLVTDHPEITAVQAVYSVDGNFYIKNGSSVIEVPHDNSSATTLGTLFPSSTSSGAVAYDPQTQVAFHAIRVGTNLQVEYADQSSGERGQLFVVDVGTTGFVPVGIVLQGNILYAAAYRTISPNNLIIYSSYYNRDINDQQSLTTIVLQDNIPGFVTPAGGMVAKGNELIFISDVFNRVMSLLGAVGVGHINQILDGDVPRHMRIL